MLNVAIICAGSIGLSHSAARLDQHPTWTVLMRNPEMSGGLYDLHIHDSERASRFMPLVTKMIRVVGITVFQVLPLKMV